MKTLVILHGWGHNSQYWEVIKSMYEQDFNVVFFDLPGFGKEPLIEDDWGVPEYAEWVKEKLNSIQGKKIILGHSFGGRVASFIASQNPNWLEGLILSGSPSIYRPSSKVKFKIFLSKLFRKIGLKRKPVSQNSDLARADKNGLGKIFRKVVPFDQTKLLPKINIPTLLVWGEYDEDVPLKIAREINNLIPNSKMEVIEKVGHNSWIENTYLFYGITKNFIKSI